MARASVVVDGSRAAVWSVLLLAGPLGHVVIRSRIRESLRRLKRLAEQRGR